MILDNSLDITIPEDLHVYTAAEQTKKGINPASSWTAGNTENHTIINISRKKRPILIGRLATIEAQRDSAESKTMKAIPSFKTQLRGEDIVDGVKVCFFRGTYLARDEDGSQVIMFGNYSLAIKGNYFYNFECIYRNSYEDFAMTKFQEILTSVKFIDRKNR